MNTKTTASKSATVAATAAVSATAPVTTPAAKAPKAPKAEKKATATTAVKAPKAPKAEKAPKVEVPSKKSKAMPIIVADIAAGVARKDTIAKLLEPTIGCSAAGANTYYQNVKSGAWKAKPQA